MTQITVLAATNSFETMFDYHEITTRKELSWWYARYQQLVEDGCAPEAPSVYIEMHNFGNFLMTHACVSYDVAMMEGMLICAWS